MCQSGGWTFHTPGLPFCRKTGAKIRDERVCERAQGDGVQRCFPVAIKNVSTGTRPTRPPTHPTPSENEKEISDYRHNQISDYVNEGKHREASPVTAEGTRPGGCPRNLGDAPWLLCPVAPLSSTFWPPFSLLQLLSAAGLFTWPRVTDSQPHV